MAWSDYVLILENPNYMLYIVFSNAIKKYEVFCIGMGHIHLIRLRHQ
jgi:hypothetical protein